MKSAVHFALLLLTVLAACSSPKLSTAPLNSSGIDSGKSSGASSKQSDRVSLHPREYDIYIYADKNRTNVRFTVGTREPQSETQGTPAFPLKVEINGKPLEEKNAGSNGVTYELSVEGYQARNRLLVRDSTGGEHAYDFYLEPLDFKIEGDAVLSHTETIPLPLSRRVMEDEDFWVYFTENQGGGFKEIAEYDESRNALILKTDWVKRLWIGSVVVNLGTAKFEDFDGPNRPKARSHVAYQSEIQARVVR